MKRSEAIWLFASCLCLSFLFGTRVDGQTFEEGYQSYMRNQFPVAELQFRAAVKKAKTREDRAFILKFIGICQFMRGDKKSSANSFYESLGSDRNVTIDEEEVLDPGVVSFFNVIKTRWLNLPENAAAVPPKTLAQPTLAKPAPITASPQQAKAAPQETLAAKASVQETRPGPPVVPAVEKTKKKKTGSGSKPEDEGRMISVLHFLPFGVGQFHNESYWLGSAFALGQVYALYQFSSLDKKISEENSQSAQVATNANIPQAERDKFILDNQNYINGLKKDKSSALTLFAALYVGSVAEALIFAPRYPTNESGPETSKKQHRKAIHTAWLPSHRGGTYLFQLKFDLH